MGWLKDIGIIAVWGAKEACDKTEAYIKKKAPVVQKAVIDFVEENKPKVEAVVYSAIDITKDNIETFVDQLNLNNTVEHKILMLGGRRAGKSTILASILHLLKSQADGALCTINDKTEYSQKVKDSYGIEHEIPSLDNKRKEVTRYIGDHSSHVTKDETNNVLNNATFLVDMTPSYGKASYILQVNAKTTSINLEFVDVPGEWMRKGVSEHQQLKEQIAASDVFVIAIDTPFLMQDDEDVNTTYNRIDEITDALTSIKIENDLDRKQIILCPVKCEKWSRAGKIDDVKRAVKRAYANLINTWVKFSPTVDIWIMPIQTVGALESVKLMPAKRYLKKGGNDAMGTSCSEDELTGLVMDKDGNTISPSEIDRLENDPFWDIDHVRIPLSWYHKVSDKFAPVFCEQPGFHILSFLVNKEEDVIKAQKDGEQGSHGPFMLWLIRIFKPTFGKYLPVWREVIDGLRKQGLIKTGGDGFEHVLTTV